MRRVVLIGSTSTSVKRTMHLWLATRHMLYSSTREACMYKNILIATDGSSLSARAVEHGTNLAKAVGATVLLLTVAERFHVFALEADQLGETPVSFREHMQKHAERTLEEASEIAGKIGVD